MRDGIFKNNDLYVLGINIGGFFLLNRDYYTEDQAYSQIINLFLQKTYVK